MRHIRYSDPLGFVRMAIEQPVAGDEPAHLEFLEANENDFVKGIRDGFTVGGRLVQSDPELLQLSAGCVLETPLDAPELWCASAVYPASWSARVKEASDPAAYHGILKDRRFTFLLKDAGGRRTVASGEPLAIRSDATWAVPEPEIGVVLGEHGKIVGYTIVNDMCCRDIRGANPLYLAQAKSYRSAAAMGPSVYVEPGRREPFTIYLRISDAQGFELFAEKTTTREMQGTFRELVDFLMRDNPLPPGTVVATGAAIVPPESFALQPGHVVEIHVPEIGTLSNPVVLVADLEERELAERRAAQTAVTRFAT